MVRISSMLSRMLAETPGASRAASEVTDQLFLVLASPSSHA
jgi:hypothetical protein